MIMELADKDIKGAILNILHMFKKIRENKNIMGREIKDLKRLKSKF